MTTSLNPDALGALLDAVRDVVASERLHGAQLAVAIDGELAHVEGFGAAGPDTPMVIMSPTKTVQDAALWRLIGDGAVEVDEPVATYLPEFGANGKDRVTVGQVMTHTGGFPGAPLDWPEWTDPQARQAAYRAWTLETEPGATYVYHPAAGAWVIADLLRAVTGVDHRELLRTSVLEPLGLGDVRTVSLGAPEADQAAVLGHRFALAQPPPGGAMPFPPGPPGEPAPVPGGLGLAAGRAAGFPGAGGVGTAGGLARLYQAYLHNPQGLWDPEVLVAATRRIRVDLPGRWDAPVQRALSVYLAGDPGTRAGSERNFFGSRVSAESFGHDGLGGNLVWSDPVSGLTFAFLTNTITFLPFAHHPRAGALSTLAARLLD